MTPRCSRTGHGLTGSSRLGGKSGVTGDGHAPFRGSLGVRFPRATRQRAVVEVLNAVYEVDFLGFSYGFRPGAARMMRWTRSRLGYPNGR